MTIKNITAVNSTKVIISIVVVLLIIVTGLYGLSSFGIIKFSTKKNNNINIAINSCVSDSGCTKTICPQVVGGSKPKCDVINKSCYCGGSCGDGYCDVVEKRDNKCTIDCQTLPVEAYFEFSVPTASKASIIFKLTDATKIQKARDILSGIEKRTTHVMGYIVEGSVSYNPLYNYYFDPSSISFFESAIELCDSDIFPVYPKEYCTQFPTGMCQFCPWGSQLIREVYF